MAHSKSSPTPNKSVQETLVSSSPTKTVSTPRRFSRRATFLHAGALIVMFAVFMFLSIQLNNRTLIERIPHGGTGYLLQTAQDGSMIKTPIKLTATNAVEMASIIDQAVYEGNQKSNILGQVTIELDKNYREKFNITQSGVVRFRGWNRSGSLSPEQVQRLLEIAILSAEPEK